MDHIKIVKRSWEILWRYRALWLFGILIAITASTSSGSFGGSSNYSFSDTDNPFNRPDNNDWPFDFGQQWNDWERYSGMLIGIGIGLACVLVVCAVVFTVLRYIANTALIRMVNDYEDSEEKHTVGQGFRLGWSRASWRIFLIDLVIGIPVAIGAMVLLAIAMSPLLLWLTGNRVAGIIGAVAAVGLFFLYVILMIAVSVAVGIVTRFMHREAALHNLGVFDSIRAGWRLTRRYLKDSLLMWLILLGIQIVYGIVTLIVGVAIFMLALVVAGVFAAVGAGLGLLFGGGNLTWILALVVGGPILLILLSVPALILEGWKEVYLSSAWTLTWREFQALKGVSDKPEPNYDNSGIQDAETSGI